MQRKLSNIVSSVDMLAAGSTIVSKLDDPVESIMYHVDVSPFPDDYGQPIKGIHIVQYATAWIDPDSRKVQIY